MDLDEGICAACGKPLGIRANWRLVTETGRAYHKDCKPAPVEEREDPSNVESLAEFAERKARNVLHGKGQQTLEEHDGG